jgi:glycosyltransferase involved in cell wall biosynthesis
MINSCVYFVPVKSKYLSKWEYYDVDYKILSNLFVNVYFCNNIYKFFYLVIKHGRFNLVYCWWWNRSFLILIICKFLNIKTLVTGAIHFEIGNKFADYNKKNIIYKLLTKGSLALAKINCFMSNHQYEVITSNFKVNSPYLLISSLSTNCTIPFNSLLNFIDKKNKNSFLSISTIIWHKADQYERKGVYETISALSLFMKLGYKFKFIIIGEDGGDVSLLKDRCLQAGIENSVDFRFNLTKKEKDLLLLESNIYLQPSNFEGFGNAVLEAMSYGVPAIVSSYTAQAELVLDRDLQVSLISPQNILEKLLLINKELGQKDYINRCIKNYNYAIKNYSIDIRTKHLSDILKKNGI